MSNLLIRNIGPRLKRKLETSARIHRRSLSDKVKVLLEKVLLEARRKRGIATAMLELIPDEFRSDDYVFEVPGEVSKPPDFD